MKKNKPYLIKWNDHYTTEGFLEADLGDIVTGVLLTSVGFYIKSDKLHHHFVQTIGEDMTADSISILKNQIMLLKELT
jgi:hypothetical protein